MADVMPQLKPVVSICWLLYVLTLPVRFYTNWFAFGALLAGVIKKHGKPQFNKEFL